MTATVKEQLIAVKELLSDPKCWIKREYARRERRHLYTGCASIDPEAGCWCLVGAVRKVTNNQDLRLLGVISSCLPASCEEIVSSEDVVLYNDARSTKHADIMALLDCAIEASS